MTANVSVIKISGQLNSLFYWKLPDPSRHRLSLSLCCSLGVFAQNDFTTFCVSWMKLFVVFSWTLFCEATCWPTAQEAGVSRKCVVTAIKSDDSSSWCTQLTKSLKTPEDPPDVFVEHRHCRVLSLPYFVLNSIFSVRVFKESRDSAGNPLGKLLVETEQAVWQSFRCMSVPQKYVAGAWTSSGPRGIRDLDEPGCAVVSALGRQSREQDRKLEGAGRDDFGSVTPRSPL